MNTPINMPASGAILIVDDMLQKIAAIHDGLDQQGYTVRVASSGLGALESARRLPPDLILLDAMMPGLDGFETCRRLKAELVTRHIPVVFMTGLTDTDHVVRGFQAGGCDYVTKPVRPQEVIARIASHLRNSRQIAETLLAADAAGDAIFAVDRDHRVQWATPLARGWLEPLLATGKLPAALCAWLAADRQQAGPSYTLIAAGQRFVFSRLGGAASAGERLLVQKDSSVPAPASLMRWLKLTAREAEVLYWVALGKTNQDIGAILDLSHRTVNKHLEHIFTKLNVETRTAAAAQALSRARIGDRCSGVASDVS